MALFTKAPEKTLTRDRDAAKANRDRLAVRLNDSEKAVIAAKSAAQRAALDGDDDGLLVAEAAERAALSRLSTIGAALAESEKLLALLESQLETMADQKLRAATSVATLALADELAEVGAAYLASTTQLAEVCTRALAISMEANGLAVFTASSLIEVAAAIPVVSEVLRQHARAVTNNLAPAVMPKVPEPPAKAVASQPKAATVRVFSTKPIKWLDEDGKQLSGGKCVDLDLPVATAERALASGACVKLDHPSRAGNIGRWPGHYSLNVCFDLDSEAAPGSAVQTVVHSAFEPIDRGKPFTLRVATGGAQ
jgi:hypothetical protein